MKLYRVPTLEKSPDLQPATIADGAGAEELARANRLVLRRVDENLLEGEKHASRVAPGARLAVDAHFDLQRLRITEFVRRHDPGADRVRAVETLALGGAEAPLHLDRLPVAGGKVVEDRVAEDMRAASSAGMLARARF